MRVVPANQVLWTINLLRIVEVSHHILIGVRTRVHSGFRGLTWQGERVSNIKSVTFESALKVAHNLNVSSKLRVHDHLDQGSS